MQHMEEIRQNAEQTLTTYLEVQEELGAEVTEVQSDDGTITVTLDANGDLATLSIADEIMRLKGNLTPKIIAVVEEAFATHALRQADIAQRMFDNLDLSTATASGLSSEAVTRARDNLNSQ